jgi:hypothetical protein
MIIKSVRGFSIAFLSFLYVGLAWIPIGTIHLRFLKDPVGRTGRKSAEKSERSALGDCFTPYETT